MGKGTLQLLEKANAELEAKFFFVSPATSRSKGHAFLYRCRRRRRHRRGINIVEFLLLTLFGNKAQTVETAHSAEFLF